mgnify:FL=1|tara:strand:- start:299 stop:478 length:180 start_codon:yes stop_codon:yes gene_type:complete
MKINQMEEINIKKRGLDKANFTFLIDLYIIKNFGITAYGLVCFGLGLVVMYTAVKFEII